MTSLLIALVAAVVLIAVGVATHNLLKREFAKLQVQLQVERMRADASLERMHQRLIALGGTLSTDFKDAEHVITGHPLSNKEA